MAWALTRVQPVWRYWVAAALLGAFPPTLTSWFIIFPMKGLPFGGSPGSVGMLNALLVNGVWGLGLGLLWRVISQAVGLANYLPRGPPPAVREGGGRRVSAVPDSLVMPGLDKKRRENGGAGPRRVRA